MDLSGVKSPLLKDGQLVTSGERLQALDSDVVPAAHLMPEDVLAHLLWTGKYAKQEPDCCHYRYRPRKWATDIRMYSDATNQLETNNRQSYWPDVQSLRQLPETKMAYFFLETTVTSVYEWKGKIITERLLYVRGYFAKYFRRKWKPNSIYYKRSEENELHGHHLSTYSHSFCNVIKEWTSGQADHIGNKRLMQPPSSILRLRMWVVWWRQANGKHKSICN